MSKIEWTEKTVNPIIGCSKVSEGCKNCYAEKMAKRLASIKTTEYYKAVIDIAEFEPSCWRKESGWNGKTAFVESQLDKVTKRKKPTRFFWCSMGDMFHESVEFTWLDACFDVMRDTPHHTHMILTKRINSLHLDYLCQRKEWPLQNVWLGVTVENQAAADERIPVLLKTSAINRYLSVEPILELICMRKFFPGLDLVICGAETGPGARPVDPRWVYDLHEQYQIDGIPFFFKKWGPRPVKRHMTYEDIANYDKGIHTVHGKVLQEFPG